jgi:SAM-dependent methyltransferase
VQTVLKTMRHPGTAYRRWRAESPSTRDPKLVMYLLRTRGLRGVLGKRQLGDDFFAGHVELHQGYGELANLLLAWARPESVLDLGCGNGYILSAIAEQGVQVQGADASPAVLRFLDEAIRDRVSILDLSQPQDLGRFDLVISTEVAEHLPKRSSRAFVENVARHSRQHVFFTAAQPGQWGDGHINCQPQGYWIELFAEHGLEHDAESSARLAADAGASEPVSQSLPWLLGNIMVFERPVSPGE